MPTQFVITGTDTGVGKTVFAAALTQALKGYYWKPVQSGLDDETDSQIVQRLAALKNDFIIPELYRLQTPVSPHWSAAIDNVSIDMHELKKIPAVNAPLIIEGAGGVLVPFNEEHTAIDLFAAWNIPVIVCARTSLGTINHTLLTIEALKQRHIPIHGIVFIGEENINTQEAIATRCGVKILGRLPLITELNSTALRQAFSTAFSLSDFQSPVWHPYRQHALEPVIQTIKRTEGAYLYPQHGERILDAISSWWVITHGHRHPAIVKAIQQAASDMDQIIFADFTHEAAENLSRELIKMVPSGLTHVFYSDSGSTAVEVAIKMALGYFYNNSVKRHKIIVMEHSYHGDTLGCMSVSERGVFTAAYEDLLFEIDMLPFPTAGAEEKTLETFKQLCAKDDVAALVIEPLVLGVAGFKMYAPWVLTELKRIAEEHDVLLIADEVMTGWGRTGTLFACEQANITPDILCTAKGLTNGSLPLAATICKPEIYAAHYSSDRRKTFFHSSSYSANAIACSAALANIKIWQDEPVLLRIKQLGEWQDAQLKKLQSSDCFINMRRSGMLVAFDLNETNNHYLADRGFHLRQRFKQKNILLRPLGNTIYTMLPYCVTEREVEKVYEVIQETVVEQYVL